MYISKRGPEFVLVATLLAMLSPPLCAPMHARASSGRRPWEAEAPRSARGLRASASGKTATHVFLYNAWLETYVSLRRAGRGGVRVAAKHQKRDANSLLRLESNNTGHHLMRSAPGFGRHQQRFVINIYNEATRRYICFNRRGRVRTSRTLQMTDFTSARARHGLRCSFQERYKLNHKLKGYQYVADEQRGSRNRLLSFCGNKKNRATLWSRRRRPQQCGTFLKRALDSASAAAGASESVDTDALLRRLARRRERGSRPRRHRHSHGRRPRLA